MVKNTLGSAVLAAVAARNLPPLYPQDVTRDVLEHLRQTQKETIQQIEYGWYPTDSMTVTAHVDDKKIIFGGKGLLENVTLTLTGSEGSYSFPVTSCIPLTKYEPVSAFVHISFSVPDENSRVPLLEMCERGFAMFSFSCGNVTADDDDFSSGLLPYFSDQKAIRQRKVGKMAVWAYAASHVLDYALTLPVIDPHRCAVVGHSRLGKTAVLAGVMDERFSVTISNNSGCSGAALHRGKNGERIFNITDKFSRWFTEEFTAWQNRENELPFDQHTVLGLIAPRLLYVCSATDDGWSDPVSEFLGAAAASDAYAPYGKSGLIADHMPKPWDIFHEGCIGYHLRQGGHDLAPEDWQKFMDFMELHLGGAL